MGRWGWGAVGRWGGRWGWGAQVEFDPRCSTERGCDRLTFFSDAAFCPDAFSAAHDFSGSGWAGFRVRGRCLTTPHTGPAWPGPASGREHV